jgi:hypothetical protein
LLGSAGAHDNLAIARDSDDRPVLVDFIRIEIAIRRRMDVYRTWTGPHRVLDLPINHEIAWFVHDRLPPLCAFQYLWRILAREALVKNDFSLLRVA